MNLKINFIVASLLFLPLHVMAEGVPDFVHLVGIPGLEGEMDIGKYINVLYVMSISVAAMIAVIKIIISGVKYMMTGLIDSKSEAVKDIRGALLGLIIIMSAVMILKYINPQLTTSSIQLDPVERIPQTTESTGTSDPAPAPNSSIQLNCAGAAYDSPQISCAEEIRKCEEDYDGEYINSSTIGNQRIINCDTGNF